MTTRTDDQSRRQPRATRTRLLVGGALAVLVAGGGATAAIVAQKAGPDASVPAAAPGKLVAPTQVAGQAAAPSRVDVGQSSAWQQSALKVVGDVGLVTRQYGSPNERHYVRIVGAKTDLTGKLELGWVADPGTAHGDYRCTQNIKPPGTQAGIRKTVLICWRATPALTVYSMAVDFDAAPKPEAVLPALRDMWRTAAGG